MNETHPAQDTDDSREGAHVPTLHAILTPLADRSSFRSTQRSHALQSCVGDHWWDFCWLKLEQMSC